MFVYNTWDKPLPIKFAGFWLVALLFSDLPLVFRIISSYRFAEISIHMWIFHIQRVRGVVWQYPWKLKTNKIWVEMKFKCWYANWSEACWKHFVFIFRKCKAYHGILAKIVVRPTCYSVQFYQVLKVGYLSLNPFLKSNQVYFQVKILFTSNTVLSVKFLSLVIFTNTHQTIISLVFKFVQSHFLTLKLL